MRKLLVVFMILAFAASSAFAAFTPQMLKFSASSQIHYNFDGSDLDIPVYVDGTSATVKFLVFTKDKANTIVDVKNGNLGWHYTNLIDTCVYISGNYVFNQGTNSITWDGTSTDGPGLVPAGDYTYYIWGYDNSSQKVKVTGAFSPNWNDKSIVVTRDEAGTPYSQPLLYHHDSSDGTTNTIAKFVFSKWHIGDDPEDIGLVENTNVYLVTNNSSFSLDPVDHSKFFYHTHDKQGIAWVEKASWVPGGDAIVDTNWGDSGRYTYTTVNTGTFPWMVGADYIGDNMIVAGNCHPAFSLTTQLIYITADTGEYIRTMDCQPIFYCVYPKANPADESPCVEGPYDASLSNGRLHLSSFFTFPTGTVNPYAETQEEFILWSNNNGDGFQDKELGQTVWQYNYNGKQDANWFAHETAYDLGSVSFSLYAPDGTGVGYFAYANESSGQKLGMQVIDDDTPYDGLYMDNNGNPTNQQSGWWYIAQDSISGTITSQVGVEESAPSAYSISQNTPNPFNPTTTISFSLAKAGKTTVDIFNVAGQKVDTLVNGNMNAGNHSVVWNAAKFSAGVYFYTVKSGSFSKTMKMTLVK